MSEKFSKKETNDQKKKDKKDKVEKVVQKEMKKEEELMENVDKKEISTESSLAGSLRETNEKDKMIETDVEKEKKEVSPESSSTGSNKSFMDGLVADYLTRVAPDIAVEFKKEHLVRDSTDHTLEEVWKHYQRTSQSYESTEQDLDQAKKKNQKTSRKQESSESTDKKERTTHRRKFSKEEDEYVLKQMKAGVSKAEIGRSLGRAQWTVSDRIKILERNKKERTTPRKFSKEEDEYILEQFKAGVIASQIGKSLGRNKSSVRDRIKKLQRNGASHTCKSFTLEEDQFIVDHVVDELMRMSHKSLKQVSLYQQSKELARAFNRTKDSILQRWEMIRWWILSCYKNTLNLDIRTMLVDCLVNNFESRDTIDWDKVLKVPEFVCYTLQQLKRECGSIERVVGRNIGVERIDVTLKQVGDYVLSGNLKKRRNINVKNQIVIIEYFEQQLEKKKIELKELDLS